MAAQFEDFQKLAKERAEIEELVASYRQLKQINRELEDNAPLLRENDGELRAMAREEEQRLLQLKAETEDRLKILLLPRDPNDARLVRVRLTPVARKIEAKCRDGLRHVTGIAHAGVGKQNVQRTKELLQNLTVAFRDEERRLAEKQAVS